MSFRKYYSNENITEAVKSNKSIAGVLKDLGLVIAGGNYDNIKRRIARLDLDTSHFTGKAWCGGLKMKDYSEYKSKSSLKLQLTKERGYKCQRCGLTKWLKNPITLELHHIDGNRYNNEIENLELLCPNCHSFTDNWRKAK